MSGVSPAAQVDKTARLAANVTVEPGACVGANCQIGEGTTIGRNSIVWSGTKIGANNRVFPFCSLGGEPQDKKYAGEDAPLVIGDNNTIREYCFFNKGTAASGGTRVGNGNWIMAYVHVAHDCVVGDGVVVANTAQLAGHVEVEDGAVLGGGSLYHQFVRVGALAMVGGGEALRHDIPPYCLCGEGSVGVNVEGMRRAGFAAAAIEQTRRAYRLLYRSGLPLQEARAQIEALAAAAPQAPAQTLARFLGKPNLRLLRPRRRA